ncbi:MAG: hypothetical protein JXR83_17030, partial [Deltaproteobacteria bacterium]|nr:hypothetical protein [Deltaproteobacteria bacterium]
MGRLPRGVIMVREVVGRWSVLAGVLVLVISIAATTGARAPAAAIATTDDRACAEIIESLRDGKTSSGSSQILGRSAPRLKQVCPAVLPGSPDWHACRWRHIGRPALDRLDTCLERTAIARDEIARRCLGHAKGKLLAREAPAKEVEAELIALGRQAGDDVAHYWRARRIASGDPGSALDPRGEVSAGGYFAYLKLRAEQKEWSGPYYLGFAERFPYVVQPRSRVPAFDGERLQFEVEAREVDPA